MGLEVKKLDPKKVKKAWPREPNPNSDRNGFWHWYLEAIAIFQNAFRI